LFFEINAFESVVSSYKSANLEIGSDDFEEALGKLLE